MQLELGNKQEVKPGYKKRNSILKVNNWDLCINYQPFVFQTQHNL